MTKKIISIVLCVVMILASLYICAFATEQKKYTGTVNVNQGSVLNVRSETNARSTDIGDFHRGDVVSIYSEKMKGTDSLYWYKVEYGSGFGYVCADYIINLVAYTPTPEYKTDATFEENLSAQGFPESYKVLLRKLHATHPSWIFLADKIPLTWSEVLSTESSVGKSLVSTSRPESYRSMEYGAYDWPNNKYVAFDGTTWVSAYKDVVAYYLEPRNFLNDDGIFMFLDQSYNASLQNIAGVNMIIKGSFLANEFREDGYNSYAELIMDAAKISGVSPYVLAAMIIQEQGKNGTGGLIQGNNSDLPGYYNHFSIGAYQSGDLTAVGRGLRYARGDYASDSNKTKYRLPWTTRAKSIIGGAIWYGDGYISVGQDTLYYKKFDLIGPSYYNHQYMTNIQAAYSEASIMKSAYKDVPAETPLIFSIPIFNDMPGENKTALPSSSGKNNHYLSSLSIDGQSIMPSFDMYKNNYETVVEYNVSSINVVANAVSGATVSGAGTHSLNVGENNINITVTAASGKKATYTISVTRKQGEGSSGTPTPEITTNLTLGTYLTGVQPLTSVDSLNDKLKVKDGYVKVFASNNSQKTSGNIATGDIIKVYKTDNSEFLVKTVVIRGDTNSDGLIDIIDLARVKKHVLNRGSLGGIEAVGGDVNHDSSIDIIDLALVKKHVLNRGNIQQ